MKKYFIVIIFFLSILYCKSQNFKFGVFLDPQLSWLTPDAKNIDRDGLRIGMEVGLILDKYFAKNYAFTTGISISNKGGNLLYEDSVTIETSEAEQILSPESRVEYKLQYVSVPVGLKFKTNEIGYFTFFAQVGFTPQVNIKAKADASDNQIDNENIKKELNLFNLSYFFGGGLEYSLGSSTALMCGIIFNNGFLDVLNSEDAKETLSYLSLRLGVMF
jgi:hypothetical protein